MSYRKRLQLEAGRLWIVIGLGLGLALSLAIGLAQQAPPAPPASQPATVPLKDPYKDLYAAYKPVFVAKIEENARRGLNFYSWKRDEKEMELSSEKSFFTLNVLDEDSRAEALVEAGIQREEKGQFREALVIYQQVIDNYPDQLYRVSDYGVFVPISQYCQRRILGFPAADLKHYRTLHDARAREAFETARRRYSLLGLSDIVDTMLATSYGGPAVMELGNAALDSGHYLAALEYYAMVREFFPDPELRTPELSLKIAYCNKMLGQQAAPWKAAADSQLSADNLAKLQTIVGDARPDRPPFHSQLSSPPNITADDYTLMPPTTDPMALKGSTWSVDLPGAQRDYFIYSQPVVTDKSIIYRHKNIVYCRSILNGELRWVNDLGGRALWQNRNERQYPLEDVLVQDGMVFTVVSKGGPSLVALDEVTGQLAWAYGPMVASTVEQSRLRFEAAPSGGPRTIYAGYVLDNIEGETHTDTEYGVIAFESTTGRLQWQKRLCRLPPGKFSGGFAEQRRNRIRSFTSPPLYHQGTVYYCTNAGAMAAVDAMSGRIKWLIRYPYHPAVHDATREFGRLPEWSGLVNTGGMHEPSFWFNQEPLLVDERLFVLPVDSPLMLCLDRRTGRVLWMREKGSTGYSWLLGPTRGGQLVLVTSGRRHIVQMIDPATGETSWSVDEPFLPDQHPVMQYGYLRLGATPYSATDPRGYDRMEFYLAARPFLSSDDKVAATWLVDYGPGDAPAWYRALTEVSLADRKITHQRRYYTPAFLVYAGFCIENAQALMKEFVDALPPQTDQDKTFRRQIGEVANDSIPVNEHGPFMPFSRVTFERYGQPFELRFGPREVEMVYDRAAVFKSVSSEAAASP